MANHREHVNEPDAPNDERHEDDTDETPESAKTRVGSNVPKAAGDGGDGTHE